jgi:hypothetical protein
VKQHASCNTQNGCYGDATSAIFGNKGRAYLTYGLRSGVILGGKRLDMPSPVKPDSQGWYPVPMPGITEFKI